MATSLDFIEYVCEQLHGVGEIRYKKMFGEYMIYINEKPIFLVCENIVYVKQVPSLTDLMANAERGIPYKSAKEQYILDVDDADFCQEVANILEPITPVPKPRKKKSPKV